MTKLLAIVHYEGISRDVEDILTRNGLTEFTRFTSVEGRGKTARPRFGTNVWPGHHRFLLIAAEEGAVAAAVDELRELKERLPEEGLKVFLLPLEMVV